MSKITHQAFVEEVNVPGRHVFIVSTRDVEKERAPGNEQFFATRKAAMAYAAKIGSNVEIIDRTESAG